MRRDGGEAPPPRPGTASCCQIKSAAASKSEREQTRKPRCVREAQEQTERGRWSALRQERLLGFFVGFLGCFFLSSVSSRVLLVAALRESILQPPPTGARCWREQRGGGGGQPLSQATSSRQGLVLQASFPGAPLLAARYLSSPLPVSQRGRNYYNKSRRKLNPFNKRGKLK